MKFVFDIVKGIFIGVANIIPGVSGGTMAVSMGVYDKLINAINNLTKKFKESFKTLLPLILGMVFGVGVFSFIIPYCLDNFAFQTCMCFAGLIIGGLPLLFSQTGSALKKEDKKITPVHIIAFVVLLAVAVWMAITNGNDSSSTVITIDFKNVVILVLLGMITAAAMVIPGISGSLILMILGYYAGIVSTVRDFLSNLKALNWEGIGHCLGIIIPFAIGCILGILLISKLISWLLKKFESITYFAILGLVIASPFAIFYKMEKCNFDAVTIIVGIIAFAIATAFTYFFSKKTKAE